jgi:hypothetical protein
MNRAIETLERIFNERPYNGTFKVSRKLVPLTGLQEGNYRLNDFFTVFQDYNLVTTKPEAKDIWARNFKEPRNLLLYGIRDGTTSGRIWGTNPVQVFTLICSPGAYNDLCNAGRTFSHDIRSGIGTAHIAVEYHLKKGDAHKIRDALNDPSVLNEALALSRGVNFMGDTFNIYDGFMIHGSSFNLERAREIVRQNKRLLESGFPVFGTKMI